MGTWDDIYKSYKTRGEIWATLDGKIDPYFLDFLGTHSFPTASVLDIGCGEGKYLAALQSLGWDVHGVDSSPTAVAMAKIRLNKNEEIKIGDMLTLGHVDTTYGLIMSINAIHHGRKEDVMSLLGRLSDMLLPGGWLFFTVLDWDKELIKVGSQRMREISSGTYMPTVGPEAGVAHSFFLREEIEQCLIKCELVSMQRDIGGRWIIEAYKTR